MIACKYCKSEVMKKNNSYLLYCKECNKYLDGEELVDIPIFIPSPLIDPVEKDMWTQIGIDLAKGESVTVYTCPYCKKNINYGKICDCPITLKGLNEQLTKVSDIIHEENELLNSHGKYVLKFAENHSISLEEANNHPMVKAHLAFYNATGEKWFKQFIQTLLYGG